MSDINKNLVIVSNRLPVSVSKVNKKIVYTESSGGLATGLSSVAASHDSVWIGWPGISIEDTTADERKQITVELQKNGCYPVFLTEAQINNFYNGYSNGTLWPLLHYLNSKVENNPVQWESYKEVNELFCDTVLEHSKNDSFIWVHDYQLMKLPHLIRSARAHAKIGFFLHTTFPSYELFRILPERIEVLEGLLGADLIGFQTYDYARHFKSTIRHLFGIETAHNTIEYKNRQINVDVYPIGIDYKKYADAVGGMSKPQESLMNQLGRGMKVLLSFDRADYTKGIPERLDGYEYFLKNNPKYHKKVVMLLVIAPSRTDVDAYKRLKEEIDLRVSRINGAYSTIDWSPISYIYRDIDFEEVISIYAGSDIMLITPLRDGMNLMAKEFVATKQKGKGVLILSERAGAASELTDSILVNPSDKNMIAEAIERAITMPLAEQKSRLQKMQGRISVYTIHKWAQDFLRDLKLQGSQDTDSATYLSATVKADVCKKFSGARKRLIILDYDGTLQEFVASPHPDDAQPSEHVMNVIKKLATNKQNKVVIVSGRPKKALTTWFQGVDVDLLAEHGGWSRRTDTWTQQELPAPTWKKIFEPIMKDYVERAPGAVLEVKDFALVWHYRNVTHERAFSRKQELMNDLKHALDDSSDSSNSIGIYEGNKIVEMKPKVLNKGYALTHLINEDTYDFITILGDDYTDEDMFKVAPLDSVTIKIGTGQTDATYRLDQVSDAHDFLSDLSKLS